MELELIKLRNGTALGLKLELGNAPLLIIKALKGYAMCGYLNMDVANKLGDVAVVVKGVKNFEEMLSAKVSLVSEGAKKLGISEGMLCEEALEKMQV
ncbi:MAG: DUF1805 domain-containing protein [Candidatus Thermoplasmatota archaeon]